MATITPTKMTHPGGDYETAWTGFTEADTLVKSQIRGGRYTVIVEATSFGTGGAIELRYAKQAATTPRALDTTNLRFTANGQYNIELGAGYVQPAVQAGTGISGAAVFIVPIP